VGALEAPPAVRGEAPLTLPGRKRISEHEKALKMHVAGSFTAQIYTHN